MGTPDRGSSGGGGEPAPEGARAAGRAAAARGARAGRGSPAPAAEPLVLALPRGRILDDVMPILRRAGAAPEPAFDEPGSRALRFAAGAGALQVIRVRAFDVATFVAFGAAHLGVCGADVVAEFGFPELYAPVDLGVGACRLVVAEPAALRARDDPGRWSHVRVATKYPQTTRRHFARRGVQAECIKLSGAVELAPSLGLCRRIVDLVQTGETLRANGLVEVEEIARSTARLVVNRAALKTRAAEVGGWLDRIRRVAGTGSDAA